MGVDTYTHMCLGEERNSLERGGGSCSQLVVTNGDEKSERCVGKKKVALVTNAFSLFSPLEERGVQRAVRKQYARGVERTSAAAKARVVGGERGREVPKKEWLALAKSLPLFLATPFENIFR